MNPKLTEKRFQVYVSGQALQVMSLDDLVDGWYRQQLEGTETVMDLVEGRQFPVCAVGMILEFLTGTDEVPPDTAILLSSHYRRIAAMRQIMEASAA
ncbi:MAG: hypothetical protein HC904_05415 [Blastochloris sp.]|nr:hypothetical protein [Blastochloris sp.]